MADDQGQRSGDDQKVDDATDQEDKSKDGAEETEDQDGGDEEKSETVSKTDFDKLFARMQAADKAKNAAEQKLRDKEQAEMSELDRAKAQLETEKARADEAVEKLKAMVIENAFHRDNKFSWHDVGDAIAALDLTGVEVSDDGKVSGMAAAIKDVAKRKPHYVKSKEEKEDQGEGEGPPAANGASNGKRKGASGETPDVKKLVARFPALGK